MSRLSFAVAVLVCLAASPRLSSGPALGLFEGTADVGSPRIAGASTYNAISQEYRLSAGGTNMWADRDEFQFAWRRMTGSKSSLAWRRSASSE